MDTRSRLLARAAAAGLVLPAGLAETLTVYYELLSRWNRRINLTALIDPDAAIDRLLLEPLSAAPHLPPLGRMLDVGSGGGSPAIPLRLVLPGLVLTMVEAKVRKAAFLREAVRHLNLDSTSVLQARLEELVGQADLKGKYDVVTVRAVRVDREVLKMLATFLSPEGTIVLFQGSSSSVGLPQQTRFVPLVEATSSRAALIPRAALVR